MTTPNFPFQDRFTKIAEQSQEAVTGAVRTWADAVQRLSGQPGASVPDMTPIVDNAFDLAERLLQTQREFTKSVLEAVAANTTNVTGAVTETVTETVNRAAEQGAQTASGAANTATEAAQSSAESTRKAADASATTAEAAKSTRK